MNTLNSRLYSLATAVILLAGAGRLGVAQQDLGSITGRVTDKTTGTGLPGVRVLLLNTPRSTSTNTEGRYVLAAVPAGVHQVRASTIGYAAQTQSVQRRRAPRRCGDRLSLRRDGEPGDAGLRA